MSKNYNVILIGIDTLRADHLGCYGYRRPTSPNIDALAKEGWLFENCFSQAPFTAPSFMSMMTGLYPFYHGVTDNIYATYGKKWARMYVLEKRIQTLAELLQEAGFKTAAFTGGGNVSGGMGFARGFDYFKTHDILSLSSAKQESAPFNDVLFWLNQFKNDAFFLFFHTYAVHNPWSVPVEERAIFGRGRGELRLPDDTIRVNPYFQIVNQIKNKPSLVDEYVRMYDGAIKYIDNFIEMLADTLTKLGLKERTIIIFTSDHGEEFFEHGLFGHIQFYNEVIRVPLIITAPGFEHKAVKPIVRLIDLLPTVLELLHIRKSPRIHGKSIFATLQQKSAVAAAAETEGCGYAFIKGQMKYIHNELDKYENRTIQLFDLLHDPKEKEDISFREPNIVESMFQEFEDELHGDSLAVPHRSIAALPVETFLIEE